MIPTPARGCQASTTGKKTSAYLSQHVCYWHLADIVGDDEHVITTDPDVSTCRSTDLSSFSRQISRQSKRCCGARAIFIFICFGLLDPNPPMERRERRDDCLQMT